MTHNKLTRFLEGTHYLSFDWAKLIMFVFFWCYGCYGALNRNSLFFQASVVIFLFLASIYFLYLSRFKAKLTSCRAKYTFLDVFILIFYGFIWFIVANAKLSHPIGGDQFYYGLGSKIYEISAVGYLTNYVNIDSMQMNSVVHVIDLAVLASMFLAYKFISFARLSFKNSIALVICSILLMRAISIGFDMWGSPHPAFQLFPIWLSTALFGVRDFSLRLPQFLALIFCSYFIYRTIKYRVGILNAFFAGIAVCSMPIFIHVSTLVEGSIWASLLVFIFLIEVFKDQKSKLNYWFSLSALLAIFTLMRLTSELLLPLYAYLFFRSNSEYFKTRCWQPIAFVFSPQLLSLPIFWITSKQGTPATYQVGEAPYIYNDYSVLYRLWFAITNNIAFDSIISVVGLFWIFFTIGLILRQPKETQYFRNRLAIIFVLVLFFCAFYSIRPILWGIDRYKAEYIIPFCMLGLMIILIKIYDLTKSNVLIPLASLFIFCYGVIGFWNYPYDMEDPLSSGRFHRRTEENYYYKNALIAAKSAGFGNQLLILGNTYGVMPEIIAGFSVSEVLRLKAIDHDFAVQKQSGKNVISLINENPNIQLVLIMDQENEDVLLRNLLMNGWRLFQRYAKNGAGVVYALVRL